MIEPDAPEIPQKVEQNQEVIEQSPIVEQSPDGQQDDEDEDDEDDNPPLLFVDVNLGSSDQQRIVVYEGDTAQDLAAKFCEQHELDDETQEKLEQLLEQQISSVLTKI